MLIFASLLNGVPVLKERIGPTRSFLLIVDNFELQLLIYMPFSLV